MQHLRAVPASDQPDNAAPTSANTARSPAATPAPDTGGARLRVKNQLRIIGGDWKRRQLPFASIEGLRPTPDRVRETLFNWLMWDVQKCPGRLDICAGSGALAFKALSRGAASVVMIEPDSFFVPGTISDPKSGSFKSHQSTCAIKSGYGAASFVYPSGTV